MIFVTGPLYAGKAAYIQNALGLDGAAFAACSARDVQELVPCADLKVLADALSTKRVVIATELGGGVVPMDAGQREKREQAGRLARMRREDRRFGPFL